MVSTLVFVLSPIVNAPPEAGSVSVTVPVVLPPPYTGLGLIASVDRFSAVAMPLTVTRAMPKKKRRWRIMFSKRQYNDLQAS